MDRPTDVDAPDDASVPVDAHRGPAASCGDDGGACVGEPFDPGWACGCGPVSEGASALAVVAALVLPAAAWRARRRRR